MKKDNQISALISILKRKHKQQQTQTSPNQKHKLFSNTNTNTNTKNHNNHNNHVHVQHKSQQIPKFIHINHKNIKQKYRVVDGANMSGRHVLNSFRNGRNCNGGYVGNMIGRNGRNGFGLGENSRGSQSMLVKQKNKQTFQGINISTTRNQYRSKNIKSQILSKAHSPHPLKSPLPHPSSSLNPTTKIQDPSHPSQQINKNFTATSSQGLQKYFQSSITKSSPSNSNIPSLLSPFKNNSILYLQMNRKKKINNYQQYCTNIYNKYRNKTEIANVNNDTVLMEFCTQEDIEMERERERVRERKKLDAQKLKEIMFSKQAKMIRSIDLRALVSMNHQQDTSQQITNPNIQSLQLQNQPYPQSQNQFQLLPKQGKQQQFSPAHQKQKIKYRHTQEVPKAHERTSSIFPIEDYDTENKQTDKFNNNKQGKFKQIEIIEIIERTGATGTTWRMEKQKQRDKLMQREKNIQKDDDVVRDIKIDGWEANVGHCYGNIRGTGVSRSMSLHAGDAI